MWWQPVVCLLCALVAAFPLTVGARQWMGESNDAENEAIRYSRTAPADAVARLQRRLDAGVAALTFDDRRGYLSSVLHQLNVPESSQTLVFAKTSFQRELISPAKPRAVYFNRDVHVGWVQNGRVLEIASADPTLGAVFYTLSQQQTAKPRFERQTRACLECHASSSYTGGVPGFIVGSVHPDQRGAPIYADGAYVTTDQSAVKERWGGWYVTGDTGASPHLGNRIDGAKVEPSVMVDQSAYLTRGSDVVALMVLGHQTHVYNLMTRASYSARMAGYFDQMRNKELGRSADYVPDSTRSVISRVAEPLVRTMLFVDEAPLTDRVSGTSGFSKEFAGQGPRDYTGRSLLELDLTQRLFRYPCSYLIYSASFDALPSLVKDYVYRRLWEVLSNEDTSDVFAHLSRRNRTAIMEILLETKPEFAAWRTMRATP